MVTDILRDADAFRAGSADAGSGCLDLVGGARQDGHGCAGLGEAGCDLEVDAAGGAGDEGRLARE
jgi:hypothetical protein